MHCGIITVAHQTTLQGGTRDSLAPATFSVLWMGAALEAGAEVDLWESCYNVQATTGPCQIICAPHAGIEPMTFLLWGGSANTWATC